MSNELELEKYKIDKKAELHENISKQKLEMSAMVKVGNENLVSIGLLADQFSKAGDLIPKEFQGNREKCFVAIYKGASLGLDAFTSLQRIAVINGRATIWGDTALSLVRKSGLMIKFEEVVDESDPQNMIAKCIVQRTGEKEHISEYSQKEALLAGLWGNNVWKKYPKRMLKYRARAFALRDIFADVLDGLYLKEEMEGGEDFKNVTPLSEEPASNQQRFQNLASDSWRSEDIATDFPDAEVKNTVYLGYEEILDSVKSCDALDDLLQFEKDAKKDLAMLKRYHSEDHKKLMAMIEDHKIQLKLASELKDNQVIE